MEYITITDVTKKTNTNYELVFVKNFEIDSLEYELSLDNGITWAQPVSIGKTSPQILELSNYNEFSIRLIAQYSPTIEGIHSSQFNEVFN